MTTDGKDNISERAMIDYLKADPLFFNRHPHLLAEMSLPHPSGSAISLIEKQVAVLRQRNGDMHTRLNNLLGNARTNDRLFDKTKRLVIALIEAQDLGDLVDALYYSFDKEFGIHHTRLIIFSKHEQPSNAARVENMNIAKNIIGKRLKNSRLVSGGIDARETQYLFDYDHADIGSSALAVLSNNTILGVLAIGNRDANYYRSSMGTLFLSYIAEVLNRLLPVHMNNGKP